MPDSAHDPAHDPTDGAPVGRRIVLGLLGIGGLGIVFGSKVQNAISNALGPLESRDPTGLLGMIPLGDVFRYYSVTGPVPHRDETDYRLTVSGLVGTQSTYPWPTCGRCHRSSWCVTSSA